MVNDDGYALVLSGGGAKGVYHIGVWQALREIGIKIKAVIGTSVGAIMAGLIAQGDYEKAESMLSNLSIDKIVTIPDQMVKDGRIILTRKNLGYLKKLHHDVIQKGGLDTHPLKQILKNCLDENKIRKSNIDLGIVTFQINELKVREIFLEDIEEGFLSDYILASATFPGFSITEIKKKKFIDGGIYNNIPFSMAKERGYKKIIIIDISGIGWNRRPDIAGTETVYIKNSIKMGGVLDFNKTFLRDYRELGYLDTLKVFNRIGGIDYFYQPDKKLYEKLEHLLYDDSVILHYSYLLEFGESDQKGMSRGLRVKGILPKEMRHYKHLIYCLAECAAWSLAVKRFNLYQFDEFINVIWKRYCEVENDVTDLGKRLSAKTVKEWIGNIVYLSQNTDINELMETPVFEYDRVLEKLLRIEKKKLPFSTLGFFFPKLTAAKVFFVVLKRYFE